MLDLAKLFFHPSRCKLTENASVHLDALRGIAALGVLLSHWIDIFFLDAPEVPGHSFGIGALYFLLELGHQWVIVFFVMSGYLVGGSVVRQVTEKRWSWGRYLFTRLTRLYVVLIPALVLGGLWDYCGINLVEGGDRIYRGFAGVRLVFEDFAPHLSLAAFAQNLVFWQTLHIPFLDRIPPSFGSNGPLWSLAHEFWYYMAFPLLFLAVVPGQAGRQRALFAVGLVAVGLFIGRDATILGLPWLMGVAIHFVPQSVRFVLRGKKWLPLSVLFMLGAMALGQGQTSSFADIALAFYVAFFMIALIARPERALPETYKRGARHAAKSSYTLYLVHLPMLLLLKAVFDLPRYAPEIANGAMPAFALVFAVVYAQIVYLAFEKNTDAVRSWLTHFKRKETALLEEIMEEEPESLKQKAA